MAVQAQYPSNAFSPDFRSRSRNSVLEELQMLQDRTRHHHLGSLLGGYSHLGQQRQQQGFNNCTVFSDPTSELTCNAPGPRKRIRDEEPMVLPNPNLHQNAIPAFPYASLNLGGLPLKPNNATEATIDAAQLSHEQSRLLESAGTSTSGRPHFVSVSAAASPLVVSPLAQEIASHLCHHNIEIDALVRLQYERLRSGWEEVRKKHCRELVSAVEQRVAKRLREKEAELENASRRNAELEEKLRQMSAENQIWFNVAKNNEAIVNSLKTSLEQVLLQNMASAAAAGCNQGCDGYGDGEGAATFPADDAQSCCFEDDEKERREAAALRQNEELLWRRACKICQEKDVCVLLFPCRHLCLCKDCEPMVDTCPICQSVKSDFLQIFMS
ncbi:probable BOI-related E3 ubiquitin-protein ligase 3 isoform X2 [Elaeis guineensis]|uniref:Probable BOI-related E3 ubiquitin-protein ligase 3 isoform X2 n=1 Tax=Elaeis guineensis var. tenera TaxID=51953 RepID=A0A6I9SF38_ELAGV|nr:probable BOI-related E3 ubiquitin-protein ligase 3 isoform X2 [Elaeis guineensis]